jgi:hypothetical protein
MGFARFTQFVQPGRPAVLVILIYLVLPRVSRRFRLIHPDYRKLMLAKARE